MLSGNETIGVINDMLNAAVALQNALGDAIDDAMRDIDTLLTQLHPVPEISPMRSRTCF
jgi:hypothetical protein